MDEPKDWSGVVPLNRHSLLQKRIRYNEAYLKVTIEELERVTKRRAELEAELEQMRAEIVTVGRVEKISQADLEYAAESKCQCGAGLAYVRDCDPRGAWMCSKVLLEGAAGGEGHTDPMPFMMWSVVSESSPRANGRRAIRSRRKNSTGFTRDNRQRLRVRRAATVDTGHRLSGADMKATIRGIECEGTPEELAEFERRGGPVFKFVPCAIEPSPAAIPTTPDPLPWVSPIWVGSPRPQLTEIQITCGPED